MSPDSATRRALMVEQQIRARGVRDPRVLAAMAGTPREAFLPAELAAHAYEDGPLPIAADQTISQPYVVARMSEALELRGGEIVLEIGTGSGYAAAVLSCLAKRVYTIERIAELADGARQRLAELGYGNVEVRCGDGTVGWVEHAPFDAIVATAGGPRVPRALLDQLAVGGRLVMPVGSSIEQQLVRLTRTGQQEFQHDELGAVRFVPLIGAHGWAETSGKRRRDRGVRPIA